MTPQERMGYSRRLLEHFESDFIGLEVYFEMDHRFRAYSVLPSSDFTSLILASAESPGELKEKLEAIPAEHKRRTT